MNGLIDTTFGLNNQALALLHFMAACEPDFTPYEGGRYQMYARTFPFYNGRERGFAVVLRRHISAPEALVITAFECRNSDALLIRSWRTSEWYMNGPTVADVPFKSAEEKSFGYADIGHAAEHIYALCARLFLETAA